MKKRINLFELKRDKNSTSTLYLKIRNISVLLVVVIILTGIGFFLYSRELDKKQVSLKKSQTIANHKLLTSSKNALRLSTLVDNMELLEKYLKDDAKFLPYYRLLTNVLLSMKGEPVLMSIRIDKMRTTNFQLRFENYEKLREFLITAETEDFTKHFEKVHIGSFAIASEAQEYNLDVDGIFTTIHNLDE